MFPPPRRATLGQRIADHLRLQVGKQAIPPGSKLPSQREMAQHLRIGLPTLREALGILVSEGLIECRPGVGTFATRRRPRPTLAAVLRTATAGDLETAREVVERRAAGEAARRADRDGRGVLRPPSLTDRALELHMRHGGSPDSWLELDAAFHQTLCGIGTGRSVAAAQVGASILDRLRPMRTVSAHRLVADDRLMQLHFDLAEAVHAGRPAIATAIAGRIVRTEAKAISMLDATR